MPGVTVIEGYNKNPRPHYAAQFLFDPYVKGDDSHPLRVWVLDLDAPHLYTLVSQASIRGPVARGLAAHLVGMCLGIPSDQVAFAKDPHGRLAVATGQYPASSMDISIARRGNIFVAGICGRGRVGVDVEVVDKSFDRSGVIEDHFTCAEQLWLSGRPIPQHCQGFFEIWTIKEAVLKALGLGFSFGMRQVETAARPDGTLMIAAIGNSSQLAEGWQVFSHQSRVGSKVAIATAVWAE